MMAERSAAKRAARAVIALVVPSVLAAVLVAGRSGEHFAAAAAPVLVALWVVMAGALALRFADAYRGGAPWAQLDVLTTTGRSVMWSGAGALVLAELTGWASPSVLGVLGLATTYLAVTWTALAAGGDEPWRRATIERAITPALAVEGEPLREEVRVTGVKIPAGMRLFAAGRATRHGAEARYAVGAEGSLADVVLASELGPAPRGEHEAPPLTLWLGDVLGLTRTSPIARGGGARFAVLPRPRPVDGARALLGRGGDDTDARATRRLPTEGASGSASTPTATTRAASTGCARCRPAGSSSGFRTKCRAPSPSCASCSTPTSPASSA